MRLLLESVFYASCWFLLCFPVGFLLVGFSPTVILLADVWASSLAPSLFGFNSYAPDVFVFIIYNLILFVDEKNEDMFSDDSNCNEFFC